MKRCILYISLIVMVCVSGGCAGIPPQHAGVQQALEKQNFTSSLTALDDHSYYLTLHNEEVYLDFLWEQQVKEANGAYYSMQLSTKPNDPIYYVWLQADKYNGLILKKVRYHSCDFMLEGGENFTSKQYCTGSDKKAAEQYAQKIERYLKTYGITPQDAFTYGQLYLENNQAIAQWNYNIMKQFHREKDNP